MQEPFALPGQNSSILVWGGLGFLGRHLVERLLNEGARVSVLCRSRSLYPEPVWAQRVGWFELANPGSFEADLLAAVSCASVIYNFAGASGAVASNADPLRSLNENCRIQLAFLTACKNAGHRPHVVFPSSWLVYAPGGRNLVDEAHPVGSLSMYGVHKLAIEQYLQIFASQDSITFTVCRISNPYGFDPAQAKGYKILNSFVRHALQREPITIFGDGKQLRDFVYIDDLTEALVRCGFHREALNRVFNIGSGESYSLVDAVNHVVKLVGPTPVKFVPWPAEYRSVEPGDYMSDIGLATRLLGYDPSYDLESGLAETVVHYTGARMAFAQRIGT